MAEEAHEERWTDTLTPDVMSDDELREVLAHWARAWARAWARESGEDHEEQDTAMPELLLEATREELLTMLPFAFATDAVDSGAVSRTIRRARGRAARAQGRKRWKRRKRSRR